MDRIWHKRLMEQQYSGKLSEGPTPAEWENWTELERTATHARVYQSYSTGHYDNGATYRLDVHNRAEFVRAARESHLASPHDGEVSTWVTHLFGRA